MARVLSSRNPKELERIEHIQVYAIQYYNLQLCRVLCDRLKSIKMRIPQDWFVFCPKVLVGQGILEPTIKRNQTMQSLTVFKHF